MKEILLSYFIFFACISIIVAHPCSTEFKMDTVEKDGVGSIHLTPTNPNVSVIQPQFDGAGKFSGGLAPVLVGNKWGYIDPTGALVIQLQFDRAGEFSGGLASVKIKNQWGYVDFTGKIVIPPRFDEAESYSEGFASVKIGKKWGYIDHTGKIVIQSQFDGADSFSEGFAPVKMGNKWGFIDPTGTFVIQPQFVSARKFSEGLASVAIEIDKSGGFKYGFIDTTGKVAIQPKFHSLGTFRKGLAYVWDGLRMVHIDRAGNIYRLTFEERFKKQFHLTGNSDNKWGAFFGLETIFPVQFDSANFFFRRFCICEDWKQMGIYRFYEMFW
ncbi:WG repeat-containing protein [Leptospira alstonii]|nr:WG repeat-containing protein [Leptospira alstonii]